jgi:hypothetical protein
MVKKLDDSMAAMSIARRERVEARVQELAGQVCVGLANKEAVVGGRGAAHLLPAALRNVEDVMPIRSDLEFQQVQAEILAASKVSAGEVRDRRLKPLQQRVEAYQQRQRLDPQRLQALDELAAQAQELKMGYD